MLVIYILGKSQRALHNIVTSGILKSSQKYPFKLNSKFKFVTKSVICVQLFFPA
jgi:hypothetical protein